MISGSIRGIHYLKICHVTKLLESDTFARAHSLKHTQSHIQRKGIDLPWWWLYIVDLHFQFYQGPLCTVHIHYSAPGVVLSSESQRKGIWKQTEFLVCHLPEFQTGLVQMICLCWASIFLKIGEIILTL